jgi:hypothetical protein
MRPEMGTASLEFPRGARGKKFETYLVARSNFAVGAIQFRWWCNPAPLPVRGSRDCRYEHVLVAVEWRVAISPPEVRQSEGIHMTGPVMFGLLLVARALSPADVFAQAGDVGP